MDLILTEDGSLLQLENNREFLLEGLGDPPYSQGTGWLGISAYLTQILIPSIQTIRITNIYDYEATPLGGFPACTISSQEIQGKILDNTRNERILRFVIRVFIDRNKQNFGANTAEIVLRSLSDEMTLKVDADPTLGGNCIDATPFGARFGYINRENQNLRVMEITLDCRIAITWR